MSGWGVAFLTSSVDCSGTGSLLTLVEGDPVEDESFSLNPLRIGITAALRKALAATERSGLRGTGGGKLPGIVFPRPVVKCDTWLSPVSSRLPLREG